MLHCSFVEYCKQLDNCIDYNYIHCSSLDSITVVNILSNSVALQRSFDSKPILFAVETISWRNRKTCMLSGTLKAEVRFRVKTENHFEATNNEQFQPNPSEMFATRSWYNRKSISLPDTFKAVTHLPVCSFLVLTHNFEVGRPVIARMEMFIILGMLLQRG